MIYKARKFEFDLSKRTYVVGILNVTPDSFSDGGEYLDCDKAVEHAKMLVTAGADILDIGAESSRPDADPVETKDELKRLIPVVERLVNAVAVPLSIDTVKADVANACLERGAAIINDISGFKGDSKMADVVQSFDAGCILMHMRGTPRTMQQHTVYSDIVEDVISELKSSVAIAAKAKIDNLSIMIDPGIGFAKTPAQNIEILKRLKEFSKLKLPLLIGPSRKSFIGKILDKEDPVERVFGTASAIALSIARGAHFIRVHDVSEMIDVARVTDAIVSR